MRLKNAKDFWSGVMFIAFGVLFVAIARNYDMGTAARMGPAYFPTVLGGLLALLGVFIAFRGITLASKDDHGRVEKFHFKPLVLVLGGVVAFALLLRPLGLVVSIAALVLISSFGSGEFKWREVVPLGIGLILLVLAVFIYGLGLTIPVLPAFMQG